MVNARKQLEYLISDVVKYGNLFIESDAGRNWEKLGTGSMSSNYPPKWAVFYADLSGNKFNDIVESLIACPVSNYQKGKILGEIKSLFNKIKELNPLNGDINSTSNGKTYISTQPEVIVKFRKEFECLFDIEVVDNYPWNGHERNDIIIIKAVNDVYQDILLDRYFSIIAHYENLEAKRIRDLEEQLRDHQNIVLNLKRDLNSNHVLSDKIEKLVDRNDQLIITKKKLETDNNLLSTQIQEFKILLDRIDLKQKANEASKIQLERDIEGLQKENIKLRSENDGVYLLEEDLDDDTHTDLFALILLNELDLLQSRFWGNSTKEKIAHLIWNMLKISKKKKLTQSSIVRYRHILLNPQTNVSVYQGWQNKYGDRVAEVINKNLGNREIKIKKNLK
jgi:hypothetical protein